MDVSETPSRIERERIDAVRRVLAGEPAASVATLLGYSERWVRKWVDRWDPADDRWFRSHSRRPHVVANRTSDDVEDLVVGVRERLDKNPWTQIGSSAILWELTKLGVTDAPSLRTIERILVRHDVERGPNRDRYQKKGTAYPTPAADTINAVQQADVVGPRYLHGGECFYAYNTIDLARRKLAGRITTARSAEALCDAAVATWRTIGIPDRLQLDNQQALAGAKGQPGKLVRLCLAWGITPTFIPFAEPWRNGVIERYHQTFDKKFYRTETFTSIEHVTDRYQQFVAFHNQHHRYSPLGGSTPNQIEQHTSFTPRLPSPNLTIPHDFTDLDGTIEWIRLIRSDQQLRILERTYTMPEHVTYEYVTATLNVQAQQLTVRHHDHIVAHHNYPLNTTMS